jgi:hypothetical protein
MLKPRMVGSLLLVFLLASCGGGSGGSGGSGGGGSPSPSPPAYSGNTSQATVSATSAPGLSDTVMRTLLFTVGVGGEVLHDTATNGTIEGEYDGDVGGKVHIKGEIRNGKGTLTLTYTDYNDGSVIINGSEVIEVLQQLQGTSGAYNSLVRHSFSSFTVSTVGGTDSYSLNGSITTAQTPSAGTTPRFNASMSGELVITSSPESRQARISNMSLTRTYRESLRSGESEWLVAGGARIHDSVAGYLDIVAESPIVLREIDPLDGPAYDGSLRLTGAGGTQFWISPLTREYVALELDASGDGVPERTLSFRWDNHFQAPASTRTGPLAISGPDLWESAPAGAGPFRLEGRFSENNTGAFLTHHWSLALAPPGSSSTITGPDTARSTFTPDQNGMYLFRLDVSDGVNASTDYLTLRAFGFTGLAQTPSSGGNFAYSSDRRTARVVLEPDIVVADGATVVLDGRRSFTPDGTPVQPSRWTVVASTPVGSTNLVDILQPRFDVSGMGKLTAAFSTQRQFSGDFASAGNLVITAPSNRRMTPTIELPSMVANSGDGSGVRAVADFNADGIDDIVLLRAAVFPDPPRLRVLLGSRDGRLRQSGAELSVPSTYSAIDLPRVAVSDINGDQRPDLLVAGRGEIGYFLQSGVAGISFGNYQATASGCSGDSSMLQIADADGDGDEDVFAKDGCAARGITLFRNNGGSLAAGIAVTLAGTSQMMDKFIVVDVNGDGRADIIARSLLSNAASWLATSTPGSYASGQAVPSQFMFSSDFALHGPVVADVDGNGRRDAFIAASTIQVLWQAVDGTLSYESVGLSGGTGAGSIEAARDFNGDGLLDLLCANGWYRQSAGRVFTWQAYARGTAHQVGDINGDGLLDLMDGSSITLQSPVQ